MVRYGSEKVENKIEIQINKPTWHYNSMQHYSISRSKYFHLLIAPIKGFISNWIMR